MDNEIMISKRLKEVSKYVTKDSFIADIGSDHAYLPVYLCKQYPNLLAIVGEVNQGPLNNAIRNIKDNQLENRIEAKLGNGLEIIDHRVNEITICGMGGSLIAQILADGKNKLANINKIIAQPNNQEILVRKKLANLDFNLSNEVIIEENGHIYEIIIGEREGNSCYNDKIDKNLQHLFGPKLMIEQNAIFKQKWLNELKSNENILLQLQKAKSRQKIKEFEIKEKIRQIKEVLQID